MAETLSERVAALEMWKESAMQVLAEYDAAWEAAGKPGPLGGSKARALRDYAIAAESREKQARVEGAREALTRLHLDTPHDTLKVWIAEFCGREYPAMGEEPTRTVCVESCGDEPCVHRCKHFRSAPPAVTEPPRVVPLKVIAAFISPINSSRWQGGLVNVTEDGAWWGYADAAGEWRRIVDPIASRPTTDGEG